MDKKIIASRAFPFRHGLVLPALIIAASLTACSSNPPAPSASVSASGSAANPHTANTSKPASSGAAAQSARGDTLGNNAEPTKRSVYFDYDSTLVSDEYKNVVAANAGWVSRHRQTHVVIQGNTDERGSREYNLALGQRRADAVKERMTLLGVPAQQIETVSFGEEKPRATDESEQAFAENRRADISYAVR